MFIIIIILIIIISGSISKRKRKNIYITPFIMCIVSKCSDKDHTVLPANYTMPAFPL